MEPRPKVNVLLVDDQPSNLLALEALLSAEGLNLVRAPSGEQALMRVLDEDYAVILMDVQMAGMDGFETAELIRQRDRSKHTPIIFLTAFQSTEAQILRGYALGAVDFLSKPVVATVLRSKVAVFVELFLKNEQVKRQAAHLVENERQEHQRALAEEKRRWEMERLREEAAKEKRVAEELARKAEELTRSIEERVRAEEQLRQRAAQQAIVAGLGQRALAGTDLGELLDEAVRSVADSLGVEFGRVMELTPEGDRLVLRAGTRLARGDSGHEAVEAGSGSLAGFTLAASEPVVVEDLRSETRFVASDVLREHGVVSGLSVIIQGRERPFGTLGAFTDRPRTFARDDVHFLQAVANVLAAAIQRRRDEDALAEVRDELAIQLADMTRLHALSDAPLQQHRADGDPGGGHLRRDRAPGDRTGRPDALRPRARRDEDGGQRGLRPRAARGRGAGDPRHAARRHGDGGHQRGHRRRRRPVRPDLGPAALGRPAGGLSGGL